MARQYRIALAVSGLLALPAAAGTFQIYEDSLGGPGVTAAFPEGVALEADIDFDADSAEGGGLLFGATEIEIRPTGSVVFVDFDCELPGCTRDIDYVFTPGGEGEGGLVFVSDPSFQEKHGIHDLGLVTFDGESAPGTIELVSCNYTGLDFQEHTCDPFTLVALPEPGVWALAAGAALLAALRRRR